METLDAVIPDVEVSLTALGTRVVQTCDLFSTFGLRVALEIMASTGTPSLAHGYNPDTFRLLVDYAVCVCNRFVAVLLPAIEAFPCQENITSPSVVNTLRELLPGLMHTTGGGNEQFGGQYGHLMECSDHSRYHLLGAEMLKNGNGVVTRLDELAGARTNQATWADGALCGLGATCRCCAEPESYWYFKAMTACGTEPRHPAGTHCLSGTTCNACAEPATYWPGLVFTACGTEPCWGRGTVCSKWTTEHQCCNGPTFPWGSIFVGTCN